MGMSALTVMDTSPWHPSDLLITASTKPDPDPRNDLGWTKMASITKGKMWKKKKSRRKSINNLAVSFLQVPKIVH